MKFLEEIVFDDLKYIVKGMNGFIFFYVEKYIYYFYSFIVFYLLREFFICLDN